MSVDATCVHCHGTGTYYDSQEDEYHEGIDCGACQGTGYQIDDPDEDETYDPDLEPDDDELAEEAGTK